MKLPINYLSIDSHATLVLICKQPQLGHGKQRLANTLGGETALAIANALLICALEDLLAWPGPRVIAVARSNDLSWAEEILPNSFAVTQGHGNLGERIEHVDKSLRIEGHTHCIFIGSDSPALTLSDYQIAERSLMSHDIVLTPAKDGGVVLMGNRQAWPTLLDLPWSSPRLGSALYQRCLDAQLSIAQLSEKFDVDEYADLGYCCSVLLEDRRPARQALTALLQTLDVLPEATCRSNPN